MTPKDPSLRKQVDSGIAYYTVCWSPLKKSDKYEIIQCVPAMAGLFELYYMDEKKKLNLFFLGKVWIGGLRHRIRRLTDPEIEMDLKRREVLEKYDCYYRFCLTDHQDDLDDVFYFFSGRYQPDNQRAEHSRRYQAIYVEELEPNKIVTIYEEIGKEKKEKK